jgi:two-component system, OmpR family, response regulator VicR
MATVNKLNFMVKKVLIVEDETALVYALQAMLKVEGFEVEIALDGEKALKKLETLRPDLIILDILLPKIEGWEVLHRVRANVKLADTPVIIVSNLTDKASREKALELGAKEFIAKPEYDLHELVAKIKDILKSKKN